MGISMNWLQRTNDGLVEQLAMRLLSPSSSVFRVFGDKETFRLAGRILSALREDLAKEDEGEIRKVLAEMVDELMPKGLGFHDLRLLATSVRNVLLASMDTHPDLDASVRRRIEDWLHQFTLVASMYFVVQRERDFQDQAADLEVQPLEKQLGELHAAYAEKTQLLNLLREVSTPIVPLYRGILLAPLIGTIDTARAYDLNEKLLRGVIEAKAKLVILDISGVPLFDTTTAEHILRTAGATKLLGAEMVLVGLSPEVAQTVVALGVNLDGLTTKRSLQDGFSYALQRLGYAIESGVYEQ